VLIAAGERSLGNRDPDIVIQSKVLGFIKICCADFTGTPEPLAVHRETLAGEVLEVDDAIHCVPLQHTLIGMHRVDMQAFIGAAVAHVDAVFLRRFTPRQLFKRHVEVLANLILGLIEDRAAKHRVAIAVDDRACKPSWEIAG